MLHIASLQAGASQHQVGDRADVYGKGFVDLVQGCAVYSLDDLCFHHGLPVPDHIKIDVDGLEPEIVRGAERVLRSPQLKSLLIEITQSDGDAFDVRRFIESTGFALQKTSREYGTETLRSRNYIFAR